MTAAARRRWSILCLVAVVVATVSSWAVMPAAAQQDLSGSYEHPCAQDGRFDSGLVTTAEGATITRLYCAAFERAPDTEGFVFWNRRFAEWVSLRDMARQFTGSREWIAKFAGTTDDEFLVVMYDHVFEREPDSGGRAYWLERLATGLSRSDLLLHFAESPEMRAALPLPVDLPPAERVYGELVDNPRSSDPSAKIVVIPLSTEDHPPPLVDVHGFLVHVLLADEFDAMWSAARADGVLLVSNGGYRSIDDQIRLRTVNGCPDIWTADADQCRVPTARPGDSNHNHGRAIDFKLSSGDHAWLAANAHRYGFYAYYSQQMPYREHEQVKPAGMRTTLIEPWHWDTTGALAARTGAMQPPSDWPLWFVGNFPGDS